MNKLLPIVALLIVSIIEVAAILIINSQIQLASQSDLMSARASSFTFLVIAGFLSLNLVTYYLIITSDKRKKRIDD